VCGIYAYFDVRIPEDNLKKIEISQTIYGPSPKKILILFGIILFFAETL
jgi:hypothetical protein